MVAVALLRVAAWAFSLLFGSLGIFFLYVSFLIPVVGADAVIFLGIATALSVAAASD